MSQDDMSHVTSRDIDKVFSMFLEMSKPTTGQQMASSLVPATSIEELDTIVKCQGIVSVQLQMFKQ